MHYNEKLDTEIKGQGHCKDQKLIQRKKKTSHLKKIKQLLCNSKMLYMLDLLI